MKTQGTGMRVKQFIQGKVQGKIAIPVYAYPRTDANAEKVSSNFVGAVYVVSAAQINNGTFKLGSGASIPVMLASAGEKCDNKILIPIYIVGGSLT